MANFDWTHDLAQVTEGIQHNTLITTFETGREQRRSKGEPRRTWNLRFRKNPATAAQIWEFYKARKGSFEPFEWIDPRTNEQVTVRFARDDLTMSTIWGAVTQIGIDLVEVI